MPLIPAVTVQRTTLNATTQQQPQQQNTLPTAKLVPETKKKVVEPSATMALVKPVLKHSIGGQQYLKNQDLDVLEDFDEDELLADSPSPPPLTPPPPQTSIKTSQTGGTRFLNRRVILKQSTSNSCSTINNTSDIVGDNNAADGLISLQHKQKKVVLSKSNLTGNSSATAATKTKGIFDRLDRKIIVNDATKRKIQRIVVKNNTE